MRHDLESANIPLEYLMHALNSAKRPHQMCHHFKLALLLTTVDVRGVFSVLKWLNRSKNCNHYSIYFPAFMNHGQIEGI